MRPRLIVSVVPDCNSNGIDADCSKCDFNVDNCYSRTEDELSTPAERIAALTSALKELGVEIMTTGQIYTGPKPKKEQPPVRHDNPCKSASELNYPGGYHR